MHQLRVLMLEHVLGGTVETAVESPLVDHIEL